MLTTTMAQSSSTLTSASSDFLDHNLAFLKNSKCRTFCSKLSQRALLLSPTSGWSFKVKASVSLAEPARSVNGDTRIIHFCREGNLKKAVELLSHCSSQKSELDVKTYCSLLELCAQKRSLKDGKFVHSVICDSDLEIDGYLGEKIVFMYVNCGDLGEARRVFDRISSGRAFVWNLLINEYSKIRKFRESISLFKKMIDFGVQPDSHTFAFIFKCFASLGSVKEGEEVHGLLCKSGFGSHNTVANSLMAFYFKSLKVESAQKVFDELSVRDVISWNSMISGFVSNDLGKKGVEVFKEMICLGIDVDLTTIINVLVACADIGDRALGSSVHSYAIKASFGREIIFQNTLLDMYAKSGDLDSAICVFEKMGLKSVVSWTSMITGYIREGFSDTAIGLFQEMEKHGIDPDIFTVTSVLHACACNKSLETGREIHNYIKETEMDSKNLFVSNALMDMYAKCGSTEEALLVFQGLRAKKDVISWNTMIGGFSQNRLPNEALALFSEMQRQWRDSKPDAITSACVLPAIASLAALDKGREIHGHVLRNGYFLDRYVANALVDMYVKCGRLGLGEKLFEKIPTKDLISWTVMIAGYGMHGLGREAIAAFEEMRRSGIEPEEVSYISILYACSHSGLVDEGLRFFNLMRNESDIKPDLDHYTCVVDCLSRAGKLSMAYKFIKTMPIEPDVTIWGVLLSGCRTYHYVKLAEKVAEHVFELEPENTSFYVLLANIYAEAEKWEEVRKLRERIGENGLRKNSGCSWIEVKGKVNIFVAGDNSHPHSLKIKSFLKRVRARMIEEDCFARKKYALINGSDAEKEIALCGHSEKLAMAFGVLSLLPGKIVRVTKNLRVCGDCHETAKFISKMCSREIVLRDSHRFHHFKDGTCSCRGFW